MFWVMFEDWAEVSGMGCNNITREMQYNRVGSIFFHSDNYMTFAYYLDEIS